MVAAALVGLGLKYIAPRLIAEGATSFAARKGAQAVAGRAMNFAAGAAGQRMITNVAGPRVAAAVTSRTGQFVGKKLATMDISQRIQGEGKYGDPGTTQGKPTPMPSSTTPSDTTYTPPRSSGPSVDIANRPPSTRDIINQYQQRRALKKSQRGGGEATGWMGTGKGWWQQNEQVSMRGADIDPTKVGDFSVARGPTKAVLPLPGRKLGQAVKRGVGQGVHTALNPVAPAEFDTTMVGKQMGVPSMPTTPTSAPAPKVSFPTTPTSTTTIPPVPTNDTWKNLKPGTRVGNFQVGTQTATTAPSPGLGQYGKDRFKEMMNSRNTYSPL